MTRLAGDQSLCWKKHGAESQFQSHPGSTAWAWRSLWKQWLHQARESVIPAPMHFAKCLQPYWRGILSRVRWPVHTGLLEGINNRIKVIKRIAYGYRDDAYFFLKIRAALPGFG